MTLQESSSHNSNGAGGSRNNINKTLMHLIYLFFNAISLSWAMEATEKKKFI